MSTFNQFPCVEVAGRADECWCGWEQIRARLHAGKRTVIAVECYPGVDEEEIVKGLGVEGVVRTRAAFKSPAEIEALVQPDLTDDPVFGRLTKLELEDFFDAGKRAAMRQQIQQAGGVVVVCGAGATLVCEPDILVYADLARWEAQLRFRRDAAANLGVDNHRERWSLQYKRAFFVDWRVADRHKRTLFDRWDFVLDTTVAGQPKLATGAAVRDGFSQAVHRPFSVVPFFDPAPWGGRWLKERFALDAAAPNYGWGFNCVPEENSLLLKFGNTTFETPAINVVFRQPVELLGAAVYRQYGAEFPIRFDFLDTMGGGNLSFQVHPLTGYIQENFGMAYTQDESYYLMDAAPDGCVYLGLKEGINRTAMLDALAVAQHGGPPFPADQFANRWPARKHDHFLIPAGTVHCSGAGALVLEISATPYIFTFKLWDWGRLGLDGRPRPIHLNHGAPNIQWNRTTAWVCEQLINPVTPVVQGDGWREERTGLHELEPIETRRHWFTGVVPHDTHGTVNVITLVEGAAIVVESPTGAFAPFVVHYGECFIVPAAVGRYTIRPHGLGTGQPCATMKAFIR